MADLSPIIETMEHRFMRAWVNRDLRALKALTARDFVLLVGARSPAMLDSRSWLDAAAERWSCSSYRFGTIYVSGHGSIALFAAQMELKARMDGEDWSGPVWVTDLWRKSKVRRRWRMVERVISRTEDDPQVPAAIKSLQLWK
jgi:ketosteroid isomerase-like protein